MVALRRSAAPFPRSARTRTSAAKKPCKRRLPTTTRASAVTTNVAGSTTYLDLGLVVALTGAFAAFIDDLDFRTLPQHSRTVASLKRQVARPSASACMVGCADAGAVRGSRPWPPASAIAPPPRDLVPLATESGGETHKIWCVRGRGGQWRANKSSPAGSTALLPAATDTGGDPHNAPTAELADPASPLQCQAVPRRRPGAIPPQPCAARRQPGAIPPATVCRPPPARRDSHAILCRLPPDSVVRRTRSGARGRGSSRQWILHIGWSR
jgi:hypothetical protein